ncbi:MULTISPECIES: hypothetical protein [Bradyrhizobium]|jgi:hypothetical protein|uniref:Sulfur globule protein n=3 Tax=Bradyrhizobium TaxID=374 RepID=A0A2U8P2U8_9BRAD|nr:MULTISPECIES: hypothetical protein [Bradyrhizobium]AWL92051.1 hypothetical protein CIT37_07440 [Bradyrhizobium ottawaense]MBR1293190.1 hypothetical protein [Bradyrhizobium ottawaense]MBR1325796.1 hypothetical protein [Bradyrhizobium ottawaense]MBR1331666.1 hypothetical protein [Bradyrhizobium ottawaense]MBR1361458.1 hypothetical protein [Bradyrhizobium ottawaense]
MFERFSKFAGRKAVLATAAVLALTALAPTASYAGGRHWHGGGGGAAAAAAFAAIGTGLAIAATRDSYAYDYGPGYGYYGGPAYYSGPSYGPYYGPGPNFQYQRYGGTAPSEFCGQGYYQNCY